MSVLSKKDPVILFVGDIAIFFVSLWLMLLIRYHGRPEPAVWHTHLVPFSILFLVWFVVFYIAGLYERRAVVLNRSRLPFLILQAQVINSVIAVLFFYFIPYYGIAPKTNLFIYLVISFLLILAWRLGSTAFLGSARQRRALLIGSGEELRELEAEMGPRNRYGLEFVSVIDIAGVEPGELQDIVARTMREQRIEVIVADTEDDRLMPVLPSLYNYAFSGAIFIGLQKLYEDVFRRIPLSMLTHGWFLENISLTPKFTYDFLKRIMDLAVSIILGLISLVFYPFAYIAIKLDDGGPVFFIQERVGKGNAIVKNIKFRTMSVHYEIDGLAKAPQPTRIGPFLRKTRIDELPQLLNVIRGDISLIGPRPEIPVLVSLYEKEIPYYNARHLIKPGLSGWAQLNQKDPPKAVANAEKTKVKLSYDLYYIKNRSFWLDIQIALKTIKDLLSRNGI